MMVVIPRSFSLSGFALVLVLHAVLLYLLLLERPGPEKAVAPRYSQLLIIVPPPPKPAARKTEPPRGMAATIGPGKTIVASERVPVESPPAPKPPPAAPADPFAETTPINIDSLVRQAGKADRETRTGREMQAYGPSRDSLEVVMTKAFTEAKLAVPLKWYEAARIEEFSPPGARKPIYQVKTAFGTYCLYYPDKLTEGTGQPKMADCPRSMGR
jgi:hypothetical protein